MQKFEFLLLKLFAESDDGGKFMVYARWGRVGVKGQDKLQGPLTSRESAISEFEQKFYAKTKNYWSNRKDFIGHPKCYTWLEMDYNDKEQESNVSCSITKLMTLLCLTIQMLVERRKSNQGSPVSLWYDYHVLELSGVLDEQIGYIHFFVSWGFPIRCCIRIILNVQTNI